MSKCVSCGNELVTGDVHWEMGLCNQCWNVYRHERMPIPQYVNMLNKEIYELQNENLKHQLAEKDKEIKELKEKEYWTENGLKLRDLFTRHQVCDEIREAIRTLVEERNNTLTIYDIAKILDQIEKGKK